MSETLPSYKRAWEHLKAAKMTASAGLGLLATNLLCGSDLIIHSNEPFGEQMEKALPSAAATPDVTGYAPIDFSVVTGNFLVSMEAARRTTPLSELAATATGGQIASCTTDALADQTGWVNSAADAGSSGMAVAVAAKFLCDKIASAEDDAIRRRWKIGAAAYAAVMTFCAFLVVGGEDAKLDMLSHSSAIAVGIAAHRLGTRRKNHQKGLLLELAAAGRELPELAA